MLQLAPALLTRDGWEDQRAKESAPAPTDTSPDPLRTATGRATAPAQASESTPARDFDSSLNLILSSLSRSWSWALVGTRGATTPGSEPLSSVPDLSSTDFVTLTTSSPSSLGSENRDQVGHDGAPRKESCYDCGVRGARCRGSDAARRE